VLCGDVWRCVVGNALKLHVVTTCCPLFKRQSSDLPEVVPPRDTKRIQYSFVNECFNVFQVGRVVQLATLLCSCFCSSVERIYGFFLSQVESSPLSVINALGSVAGLSFIPTKAKPSRLFFSILFSFVFRCEAEFSADLDLTCTKPGQAAQFTGCIGDHLYTLSLS
jgi:hypothetical protein